MSAETALPKVPETCVCGTPQGVAHFCTGDPKRNGKATAWERK